MKAMFLRTAFRISVLRTLIANFKLFKFKQAIHLPLILSRSTHLESLKGLCRINGRVKVGMIRIGFIHADLVAWNSSKSYLNINGTVIFNGSVGFGVGTVLVVDKNSLMEFGDNVIIGANSKIICRENIKIGNNFRSAWETQIIDTNFHYVKDIVTGQVYRKTKSVTIGDNNWLGNRSSVMQGTVTPDFFIMASNSICNKDYSKLFSSYTLVGGSPAKFLKSNVYRVLDFEEKEIDVYFDNNWNEEFLIIDKTVRSRF